MQDDLAAFARGYFPQLGMLAESIEVTFGADSGHSFPEGVARAIALIRRQAQQQNKVIFIGNGGSAGIASHQAIDYLRNGGIPALSFNDGALLTCIGNDFGYEEVFRKPVSMFANPGDILFAISSSGQSANILAAALRARELGCHVLTLSAFQAENPLRSIGEINFYVPTSAYGYAEIAHLCICHCILDGMLRIGP